jgi:hypothetical protein
VTTHNDNIETVKQLKARYVRSLNTNEREVLQHLFVVDAVVDMHAEGVGETRTAEEFVESLKFDIEEVTTVHHGHTPRNRTYFAHHLHRHLGHGRRTVVARRRTATARAWVRSPLRNVPVGERRVAVHRNDADPTAPTTGPSAPGDGTAGTGPVASPS